MIQRANRRVPRIGGSAGQEERLPYRIELWRGDDGAQIERVVARACSAALARAIFEAVRREYPQRRITLRRGARIIAESAVLAPLPQPEPRPRDPSPTH